MVENVVLVAFLVLDLETCHSILTFIKFTRTVPTSNDILVPETLLKKRKSQEKEREAKAAETEKRKAVSTEQFFSFLTIKVK